MNTEQISKNIFMYSLLQLCVCVCVLRDLRRSREGINDQFCLKFDTYNLGESLEVFFSFFRNCDFWALVTWSRTRKGPKLYGVR